jgi:hypothetical protein
MERYDHLTDDDLLKRLSENPPDTPDWIKSDAEIRRRLSVRQTEALSGKGTLPARFGGFDPLSLLRSATEAVPATKWAVGVVGLAAAAAIILAVTKSAVFGVIGIVGVLAAMIALFVFSRLLAVAAAATRPAAVFLMWVVVTLFAATVVCLFTSSFFNAPWPLRERLFTTAVAAHAEAQGKPAVAAAARDLSPSALAKLVQINDSRNMVGASEPDSQQLTIVPIPPEIRELDAHGMITWSEQKPQFEAFARQFGVDLDRPGNTPQVVVLTNLSQADKQRLRNFSYQLNERGVSLYKSIIDLVIRQLQS